MNFRHSITLQFSNSFQIHLFSKMCLKSELLVQILQTILCNVWTSDYVVQIFDTLCIWKPNTQNFRFQTNSDFRQQTFRHPDLRHFLYNQAVDSKIKWYSYWRKSKIQRSMITTKIEKDIRNESKLKEDSFWERNEKREKVTLGS